MKTYLSQSIADKIRQNANNQQKQINFIVEATSKLGIELTPEIINQLHVGDSKLLTEKLRQKLIEQPAMSGAISSLIDNLNYAYGFTFERLPASAWDGVKINEESLNEYITRASTLEVDDQTHADILYIEQLAETMKRFNPFPFITSDGKADIQAFIKSRQ